MEFQTGTPPMTAMYLVDRGMQGKYYRWYDAETNTWSMCGSDMTEALSFIGRPSPVGFFPWVGPMTGPRFDPQTGVAKPDGVKQKLVDGNSKNPALLPEVKPAARKMARQRTVVPLVKPASKGVKNTHPDGTVFFREDRQKWVAIANGKQEAARPTPEACLNFLMKKYGITGVVLK